MRKYVVNVRLVILLVLEVVVRTWLMGRAGVGVAGLSMEYYGMSCPFAEMTVRNMVSQALSSDPTLSAGLLRLHFHDCFVQGCDASVLLDSTSGNVAEKDAPPNKSLRGFEVIDQIKQALEMQCPGIVSCADILALASRDAVDMAGGPYYEIANGRRDGSRSNAADTVALPAPFLNVSSLIQLFGSHGFTVQELVALSGGHTLGVAHCPSFKNRLSNFDSTNDVDPSLEKSLAESLASTCSSGGDDATATFDETSEAFDTVYFWELQTGRGLLSSDQTLFQSPETQMLVNQFAMDPFVFFYYFQQGMLKMGQLDVKEGVQGEIRKNCRVVNDY